MDQDIVAEARIVEYMEVFRKGLSEGALNEDQLRESAVGRKEFGFTKCPRCKGIACYIVCRLTWPSSISKGVLDVMCDNCGHIFCEHDKDDPRCDSCGSLV